MFADETFWALVALVIFVGLVIYVKVPGMVLDMLDRRGNAIRAELEEAKRLRMEAEALLADYQKRGRDAEAEAAGIVKQAKHEAEVLAVEAKQRIEDYVARRTRAAEQKIAQAEQQALQEVRSLSADVAIAAAERIVSAHTKGASADRLIDSAIGEVKARLN